MFIVEVEGKKHLFLNSKGEDFIQFLPRQFEVELHEIKVDYIKDSTQKLIRKELKNNPNDFYEYDFNQMGLMKMIAPLYKAGHSVKINDEEKIYTQQDPECNPTFEKVLDLEVEEYFNQGEYK